MFKIFVSGGLLPMSLLTVLLVALFFAAWKAPRWVKEIGNSALVLGLMTPLFPLYQLFTTLQQVAFDRGEFSGIFDLISPGVLFSSKVLLIPVIYGMCIYLVAQLVQVLQKPRL